jgi:hypothetical protein
MEQEEIFNQGIKVGFGYAELLLGLQSQKKEIEMVLHTESYEPGKREILERTAERNLKLYKYVLENLDGFEKGYPYLKRYHKERKSHVHAFNESHSRLCEELAYERGWGQR